MDFKILKSEKIRWGTGKKMNLKTERLHKTSYENMLHSKKLNHIKPKMNLYLNVQFSYWNGKISIQNIKFQFQILVV